MAKEWHAELEPVEFQGEVGLKITCACRQHDGYGNSAVITDEPTAMAIAALTGDTLHERVHGFVLLANNPASMIRAHNARRGLHAAA